MLKDEIILHLKKSLEKLKIKENHIDLEHPTNFEFGDYSTSIALKLAKILKKNPLSLAHEIAKNYQKHDLIDKVEIIKPGFINFWIKKEYLLIEAQKISRCEIAYLQYFLGKAKKIIVEFAHPNTHKLFHIGHLRNITTGESIVRILEATGNKVIRANYQGDVGLHIAKALWQLRKQIVSQSNNIFKDLTLLEKIKLLGKAYTDGNKAYESDENAAKIIKINEMIYNQNKEIMPLWQETKQWSLDYFATIYKRVNSHFDRLFFESEMAKRGVVIVNEAVKNKILERSKGAIVFIGKKYNLDTRVFITALGFPTYEGKELALAEKEFSEFGEIDKCIHVVSSEQTSFFKVTFKVEELINCQKYKNKQHHLIYGWVRLKSGKMSSRRGNVVEGELLLDEAKKEIIKNYQCGENIAEVLAVAAVKYSFLKNSTQGDTIFDFEESVSLEGNSGPYLIYTYVRTRSVLKKQAQTTDYIVKEINNEEMSLLRSLYQFPEIVKKAAANFAPNYIANYLFDLAQKYNLFYQKHSILNSAKDLMNFRLMLTQATGNLIKNGLYLLGIKTVEKM